MLCVVNKNNDKIMLICYCLFYFCDVFFKIYVNGGLGFWEVLFLEFLFI